MNIFYKDDLKKFNYEIYNKVNDKTYHYNRMYGSNGSGN